MRHNGPAMDPSPCPPPRQGSIADGSLDSEAAQLNVFCCIQLKDRV